MIRAAALSSAVTSKRTAPALNHSPQFKGRQGQPRLVGDGYPAWIRTKNNASKGRCVTVTPRGIEIFDLRLAIADLQFSIKSPEQDLNRNLQIAICKLARGTMRAIILRDCRDRAGPVILRLRCCPKPNCHANTSRSAGSTG